MTVHSGSLEELLAKELPKDKIFKFSHISTPPYPCAPLYSPPPSRKPERTFCECHFLDVSIPCTVDGKTQDVLVLAVEILIYTTKALTTVFVSKADSTGYLSLHGLPRSQTSPLRSIVTTFLSYLVRNRLRSNIKFVITLFARAADQYLFPGSVENPHKHISDDRQLVKWWCRVLDPILKQYKRTQEGLNFGPEPISESEATAQAYLTVPGEDNISSFLPSDVRTNPSLAKRWKRGDPLRDISSFPAAPPRCLVPHFPDDPKARYLDELDAELPDAAPLSQISESPSKRGSGQWRTIKTLEQFWEMMAHRQECSSGRLVGFIWIVISPPKSALADGEEAVESHSEESTRFDSQTSFQSIPSSPPNTSKTSNSDRKAKKVLRGPIIARTPKIKKSASVLSNASLPEDTKYYHWPPTGRGSIIVVERDYKKAIDHLLKLDFSTVESAAASTSAWMAYLSSLIGAESTDDKRLIVVGQKEVKPATEAAENGAEAPKTNGVNVINVLSVKKGKAAEEPPSAPSGVNVLGAGLVRKKPKA